MVTTKGTGLNPNAKVWQELPAEENEISVETSNGTWLQTYPPTSGTSEDVPVPIEGKGLYIEYLNGIEDYTTDPTGNKYEIGLPESGCCVFSPENESATDLDVPEEQQLSEETIRESLKYLIESCFSRENLSKDLYLISQMDSDQFVPVWTIASMEDVKALTTDINLILSVLRASPLVQVDEAGEKVRPNHSRCIIILREIPETTPIEEVKALFQSENCPKVLRVEFAHNSNWYITFQSDMDAQQAFKYLREDVKVFQGKPIMARIKAVNTFFGKNGFRITDSAVYQQHPQLQPPCESPVFVQQMYSPQQQYPVYPIVSPSWSAPVIPQYEMPLAPFPNGGFMNGFSSESYKANSSSIMTHCSTGRNSHPRPEDIHQSPLGPEIIMDVVSGSMCLGDCLVSGTQPAVEPSPVPLSPFCIKDIAPVVMVPSVELNRGGRERRGVHRGMRRKRDEDHAMKPTPLMEARSPIPKFDFEASSFPPLPGFVLTVQEEAVAETRLSDVVRGTKVATKVVSNEVDLGEKPKQPESPICTFGSSTSTPPALNASSSTTNVASEPTTLNEERLSTRTSTPSTSEHIPAECSQADDTEATCPSPSSTASEQEPKKLSYAEVCQRLAKEAPSAQIPPPASNKSSTSRPLQELKVNTVKEPQLNSKKTSERHGDKRHHRHPLNTLREAPDRQRGSGFKKREHHRGPNPGKRFYPQQGTRRSGKEQNIPPTSPK